MFDEIIGLLVAIPVLLFTVCLLVVMWTIELILILVSILITNPHILLFLIILYLLLK
jgi:hypothetical protein